jgi:hypothetical protein
LSRGALGHGQEPKQDVLGAHEAVAQPARLLVGALKGRARRLCEVLAQVSCLSIAARTDLRLACRRS